MISLVQESGSLSLDVTAIIIFTSQLCHLGPIAKFAILLKPELTGMCGIVNVRFNLGVALLSIIKDHDVL